VLVTIDDLEALLVIMRQTAADPTTLEVQFSGGYFTDAEDMRHLSDDELRSLKVHSDSAEVNLGPEEAVAVGSGSIPDEIYRTWARARQTSIGAIGKLDAAGAILLATTIAVLTRSSGPSIGRTLAEKSQGGAVMFPMSLQEFRQNNITNQWPKAAVYVSIISAVIAVAAIVAGVIVPIMLANKGG
jgi:hypothetical protein